MVSFLKGVLDDFQNGLFDNFLLQVDAELNADYLTQAESLIKDDTANKSYIPAAVLAGAVLEHRLKAIYNTHKPPNTIDTNSKKLTLGILINELKKLGVYNELTAKHLRAYADIRNAAAHGNFGEFNSSQVKEMINGIRTFLASHAF